MSEIFSWPVRVYYEDTDTGGVVYYANYLKFMERARTEWLRDLGFEQDDLIKNEQMIFAVRSVQMDYLKPALFNQALEVTASIATAGKASVVFEQEIIRNNQEGQPEVLARGKVKLACLNSETLRPRQIPDPIAEVIQRVI
jgi:acyl-CoA thioester hydrolase